MDDQRIVEPSNGGTSEADAPAWYRRLPWKQAGLIVGVLLLWLLIGLACPPSSWRF